VTLTDFLKLSWEIQLALASGYCAYVLAYTGLRDRQRPIDAAFISLVFSLFATFMLWILTPSRGPLIAGIAAFGTSLVAGVLWRRIGRDLVMRVLRLLDVTWQDDAPSALATLSANTKHRVSQVAVELDNGDWLCCDDTRKFEHSPFGPFQLGPNGDIAMYVTDIIPKEGEPRPQTTLRDAYYGDRITYLPAARIKQITFRHPPRVSRSSRAVAAELDAPSRPEPSAPSAAP
jgi:hypothetical protein